MHDLKRRLWLTPLVAARAAGRVWRPPSAVEDVPAPFIVGSPRSGTTLLRLMVDAHRSVAIPPETGFITPLLRAYGTERALRRSVFVTMTRYGWEDFGIPPADLQSALAQIEPFSVGAAIRCFYQLYAARFGKPRWGNKTPLHCLYMRAIEQLLPEAHFIHIIRDGRDVALSLRERWFAPGNDMTTLAAYWRRNVATAQAQGRRCRHYLELRYEDLVLDTSGVLERVCAFLALDYDAGMLQYYGRAAERLQEHGDQVVPSLGHVVTRADRLAAHSRTLTPPDPSRLSVWRQTMRVAERREFERVAGPLLASLGYDVGA